MPSLFEDTEKGKSHESVLKSFHIVCKIKEMLARGDSRETILEIIDQCYK